MDEASTITEGVRIIREAGYSGCVELTNETTRVVLEPNVGGRVTSYTFRKREALHQNPSQDGVTWNGQGNIVHPAGGRFDIGPEYRGLARADIWFGQWTAEIDGPRAAILTSRTMPDTGLQLQRSFVLDRDSSRLHCTQRIVNRGAAPFQAFHWGRTFAPSGGVVVAPIARHPRFPGGYALGVGAGGADFLPETEPNVRIREDLLEILGPPRRPKFYFDVDPGWLAYAAPVGLLFVKRFAIDSGRPYGDLCGNNASIWYGSKENTPTWPLSAGVVEIEPIGPLETLAPGEVADFTEEWSLYEFEFEADRPIDLPRVRDLVAAS